MAAAIALLAGCETGPFADAGDGTGQATEATPAGGSVQLTERDVEAREVFEIEDSALWDGRPSLGGIWVAAPGVTNPERVIIRNAANGTSVIGALFKRERDNPGPALQLSSEAAAALDILAGSPTTVEVVALRREPPPEAPKGAGDTETTTEKITETAADAGSPP